MTIPRITALALAPALALAATAGAQDKPATTRAVRMTAAQAPKPKTQDELAALRDEKLAKEVFTKAPWITDYDAARAAAAKTGKPIFAYFTRSYAY